MRQMARRRLTRTQLLHVLYIGCKPNKDRPYRMVIGLAVPEKNMLTNMGFDFASSAEGEAAFAMLKEEMELIYIQEGHVKQQVFCQIRDSRLLWTRRIVQATSMLARESPHIVRFNLFSFTGHTDPGIVFENDKDRDEVWTEMRNVFEEEQREAYAAAMDVQYAPDSAAVKKLAKRFRLTK